MPLSSVCVDFACRYQEALIGVGIGSGQALAEKLLTLQDWDQIQLGQHRPRPGLEFSRLIVLMKRSRFD